MIKVYLKILGLKLKTANMYICFCDTDSLYAIFNYSQGKSDAY